MTIWNAFDFGRVLYVARETGGISLEIIQIPIEQITPYEKNPRKNDDAVKYVMESIREFGAKVPIVIDKDRTIVAGHTRLKAAKKLGMEMFPCIVADDLTPKQIKAFRLADNKVAEKALWDFNLLDAELDELLDFNMEQFGFDTRKNIELGKDGEPLENEELLEVTDEEVITRIGDVIKIGEHVLMCGNSCNPDDIKRLMYGAKADLLLTDPPYNIDYEGKTNEKLKIENDAWSDNEAFQSFLHDFATTASNVMHKGAAFYIWHASTTNRYFIAALDDTGLMIKQTIIWVKDRFTLGRQDYQWQHEPCLYGWKEGAAHSFIENRTLSTVWDYEKTDQLEEAMETMKRERMELSTVWRDDKPSRSAEHPTMKPVSLFVKSIKDTTDTGDIVLDPFGGSGTAVVACEMTGRSCRTMEIDPRFCDVIVRRWEDLTGQKAERPKRKE